MTRASCEIWIAGPEDVESVDHGVLHPDEVYRAARYRSSVDRARFLVGCALTRIGLAERMGIGPAAVVLTRECSDCGGPHGRPLAPDSGLHVSVSHSGSQVVVAVTDAGPVGIDVERFDAAALDVVDIALTEREQEVLDGEGDQCRISAALRYWVRKEAVLKALGVGLKLPMDAFEVSDPREPAALLRPASESWPRILLEDLDFDRSHAGALAVLADEAPAISPVDVRGRLASLVELG